MGSNVVSIKIQTDASSVKPGFDSAAASTQAFVQGANALAPALDSAKGSGDAFTQSLAQLNSAVEMFRSGVTDITSHLDKIGNTFDKTKEHAEGLAGMFGKVEHNAEFRELSLSIREGIENPLGAAKNAAEAFFLSFGMAGVAATATMALGAAAFELSTHVGELAHGYQVLGGELGIAPEKAERLARAFQLVGEDTGALAMANRTLSKVLDGGTEADIKLRQELTAHGVVLRDVVTGAYRPFDELVLDIVSHLSTATDVVNAHRIGSEALGRTFIKLLGVAKELPEAYAAASGGLSAEAIESANRYELGWQKIKLGIEDAANEVGVWLIKLDQAAGKLDEMAGTDFKKHNPTTYVSQTLARLGGAHPAYGPGSPELHAGPSAKSAEATKAFTEAMKSAGSASEQAEKHLAAMQAELGKYDGVASDFVTSTGITVGALEKQIAAEKAHVQSLKNETASLSAKTAAIKGEEAHQLAAVALEAKSTEDRRKVAEVGASELVKLSASGAEQRRRVAVKLAEDELAIELKSIHDRKALLEANPATAAKEQGQIAALSQAEVAANDKANAKKEAANQAFAMDSAQLGQALIAQQKRIDAIAVEGIALVDGFQERAGKAQSDRIKKVATEYREAQLKEQRDNLETEKKQLEGVERVRMADLEASGAGYGARIELVKEYGAKIAAVVAKLGELAVAEGAAKDAAENAKYTKSIEDTGVSPEIAAQMAAPGITHAGQNAAQAAAAKATADQVNATADAVGKLNEEFKKNAGEKFFNELNGGLASALGSWVNTSRSFGQAWAEVGRQMLADMTTNFAMMGIKAAEFELKSLILHRITEQEKLAATETTTAEKTALQTSGAAEADALEKTSAIKSIFISAKKAYAAVSANEGINAIPIVGPALAQAAGAAAFAGIMALAAFEQGGVVGADQLAMVHKNEMVLPAHLSQGFQSMLGNGSPESQGNRSGGGDTHIHYHAAKGDNPNSIRQNKAAIMDVVRQGLRAQNLLMR